MTKSNKKVGFGILSLVLFIIGITFPISFRNNLTIGDSILQTIGLKPWSNGNTGIHYTVYYSLVFFIPSIILGYKHRSSVLAKIGFILSFLCVIALVIAVLFFGAI